MKKVFLLLLALFVKTLAFSQGHYVGSSFNPNDYFAPHAGLIIPVYYGYANMNYYNNSGNKSDVIIGPTPTDPTALNIQQNVVTHSFILMAIYGGKKKILGADWGVMAIPVLNSPAANIVLDYYSNKTGTGSFGFSHKSWGFNDLYIQPVWLSWTKDKWTYGLTYGVWAPIGRFKPHDLDNSGLGYWSHNIRVATRFKPIPLLGFTVAATYEINQKQKETDFIEGSHLTIDYGASYRFSKKGDEVGIFGHYATQVTDDKRTEDMLTDRIWAVGGYCSYWIKPGRIGVLGRITQNFAAENRFAGTAFQIGANILFPSH
jgi:hypothetical protein